MEVVLKHSMTSNPSSQYVTVVTFSLINRNSLGKVAWSIRVDAPGGINGNATICVSYEKGLCENGTTQLKLTSSWPAQMPIAVLAELRQELSMDHLMG